MRKKITEIPEGNYIGYYWLSNAQEPVKVTGSFPSAILNQPLPFVVEGNLYDTNNKISISIRHNGSKHIIHQFDLKNTTGFGINPVEFIAHRLPGVNKVKFLELWKEVNDTLCEMMTTLRPYARVFVGFEEQNILK